MFRIGKRSPTADEIAVAVVAAISSCPPSQPVETDEEKAKKERTAGFAELRAEEDLQIADSYREAARKMREGRMARLLTRAGSQNP
jgi:hypothetical protein